VLPRNLGVIAEKNEPEPDPFREVFDTSFPWVAYGSRRTPTLPVWGSCANQDTGDRKSLDEKPELWQRLRF